MHFCASNCRILFPQREISYSFPFSARRTCTLREPAVSNQEWVSEWLERNSRMRLLCQAKHVNELSCSSARTVGHEKQCTKACMRTTEVFFLNPAEQWTYNIYSHMSKIGRETVVILHTHTNTRSTYGRLRPSWSDGFSFRLFSCFALRGINLTSMSSGEQKPSTYQDIVWQSELISGICLLFVHYI